MLDLLTRPQTDEANCDDLQAIQATLDGKAPWTLATAERFNRAMITARWPCLLSWLHNPQAVVMCSCGSPCLAITAESIGQEIVLTHACTVRQCHNTYRAIPARA